MPRKKLTYTSEYPYHIVARSNNKEFFYLPKNVVWNIFIRQLRQLNSEFNFQIYGFVLMDNHYHLLASTSNKADLGVIMQRLQLKVSKAINKRAQRINHTFGGPYKASLITNPYSFLHTLKYLLRNPIQAGLTRKVESYKYTDAIFCSKQKLPLSSPVFINQYKLNSQIIINWSNSAFVDDEYSQLRTALKKTVFVYKNRNRESYEKNMERQLYQFLKFCNPI